MVPPGMMVDNPVKWKKCLINTEEALSLDSRYRMGFDRHGLAPCLFDRVIAMAGNLTCSFTRRTTDWQSFI
jgi:hypothetical protein